MKNEKIIDVLQDLIKINNDRIEGYEKALEDLDNEKSLIDRGVFEERIAESSNFRNELESAIIPLGGETEDTTTAGGKLYRVWMDLKTSFTGGSPKSVLELCEYGEDVALKAYDEALEETELPQNIHTLINQQRQTLKRAHDIIKSRRDTERVKA